MQSSYFVLKPCPFSLVVERPLRKRKVVSSILTGGTVSFDPGQNPSKRSQSVQTHFLKNPVSNFFKNEAGFSSQKIGVMSNISVSSRFEILVSRLFLRETELGL